MRRFAFDNRNPQGPLTHNPVGKTIAQLKQIGELHQAGILSDEEFAATKARLLGL